MLGLMTKEAEWTKRVAEWRSSGLTAAEFCASHDYSAKTLWYWSSKLGRASRDTTGTPSVRLVRVARQRVAPTPSLSSISVEVAGAKLTLHGNVDEVALRTVVMTLRDLGLRGAL
jgi:transposase